MVQLNLIPEAIRAARARRRRGKRWSAAMTVGITAVVLVLGVDSLQYTKIRSLRNRQDQLQVDLRELRKELAVVTSQAGRALAQCEHAEALRSKRAWSGMFGLIGSCIPSSCWLTSLGTDPATPSASSPKPAAATPGSRPGVVPMDAPRKLRMSGYAPDAALPLSFVRNLKGAQVFSRVSLSRSVREPTADGSFFRFEVDCEW